jgi:CheY-like chemotaxis protein
MGWTNRATAMSNLIWTTEKPTKPGWYWYRSQRDRVQIIELIDGNKELRTIAVSPGMYSHQETHRAPDGPEAEWAGPIDPPGDVQRAELVPSSAEDRQESPTILLVDDDDMIRQVATTLLKRQGYTVLEAEDGNACLKIIHEYPGPIHLLMTDIFMPGMNGRKIGDHLHTLRKETKILFMSGHSNEEIFGHDGLYPEVVFLSKPFTPEILLRKISETLEG